MDFNSFYKQHATQKLSEILAQIEEEEDTPSSWEENSEEDSEVDQDG